MRFGIRIYKIRRPNFQINIASWLDTPVDYDELRMILRINLNPDNRITQALAKVT